MGLKNVSFDDRDREHLVYSFNWFFTGSWNASDALEDVTGTLTSANSLNANVSFTFPQPANAFYYYGMKRSSGALYAICFDGDCDPSQPDFTHIDALGPDDGRQEPSLIFFKSFDNFAIHKLILTNQNDTRRGKSQITIDRFEIQVQDSSPDISSSFVVPSASFLPSASLPSVSSSSSPAVSSNPWSKFGPIVGGVVGGLLACVGLCALMLIRTRRRRKRKLQYPPSPSTRSFQLARYGIPGINTARQEKLSGTLLLAPPSEALGSGERRHLPLHQTEIGSLSGRYRQLQALPTNNLGNVQDRLLAGPSIRPLRAFNERSQVVTSSYGGSVMMTESGGSIVLPPDYRQIFGNTSPL